jgi:two-component system chemotaxis response regulator CheB
MNVKRMVVIGASTGGVEALMSLVARLPAGFAAAVCVVIHRQAHSVSLIGQILQRAGALPARDAADGEQLQPGHIYIAPADQHLLIEPGQLKLSHGPRENRSRPAIDPLFRSAAQVYGPNAIGVVLTGELDDGAAGLDTIRRLGGVTIVQDPADALAPAMPTNALRYGVPDYCVPLKDIPALLVELLERDSDRAREHYPVPRAVEVEVRSPRKKKP